MVVVEVVWTAKFKIEMVAGLKWIEGREEGSQRRNGACARDRAQERASEEDTMGGIGEGYIIIGEKGFITYYPQGRKVV